MRDIKSIALEEAERVARPHLNEPQSATCICSSLMRMDKRCDCGREEEVTLIARALEIMYELGHAEGYAKGYGTALSARPCNSPN